ncbi:hypothetical protein DBR47_01755 [Paucibacter sp. KBW04]|nr:hypothetical protein DBR47_01755 [Paucibacter sp. KBW04]
MRAFPATGTLSFHRRKQSTMKKIFAAAALSLIAASASAAGNGWYVGADVGSTKFKNEGETITKTGFGALVGYSLSENVAFEATVRRLGSWDVDSVDTSANALQVSVLGILPLGNGFSLYGRLGASRNSLDASYQNVTASVSSTEAVFGLGAAYQINNNFSVRAEYADLGNNKIEAGNFSTKVKINQFNVGLNYAF